MLVKSLKPHPYGGRYHAKGSEYDITKKSDIRLMVAIKCVEPVEDKKLELEKPIISETKTPFYSTKQSFVAPANKVEARGRKRKEDQFYDRKDIRANDNRQW